MRRLLSLFVLLFSSACMAWAHDGSTIGSSVQTAYYTANDTYTPVIKSNKLEQAFEVYGGIGIDERSKYSFGTAYSIGGLFGNWFYIGGGVAFRYTEALHFISPGNNSYDGKYLIPVFARVTTNLLQGRFYPFLRCDAGYTFDVGPNDTKNTEGFFILPSVGFNFSTDNKKSLYATIGLMVQRTHYEVFYYFSKESYREFTRNVVLTIGMKF